MILRSLARIWITDRWYGRHDAARCDIIIRREFWKWWGQSQCEKKNVLVFSRNNWGEGDWFLTGCRWLPDDHERRLPNLKKGSFVFAPPLPSGSSSPQWPSYGAHNIGFPKDMFLTQWQALSLSPNPDLESQYTVFINPGVGWPILVASYDTHGLRWDYSYSRPPHGNVKTATLAKFFLNTCPFVLQIRQNRPKK